MRWIVLIVFLFSTGAWALTPIFNAYDDKNKIYQEFKNIYDGSQDIQHRQVVLSTPNWQDLRDGEIVIYVSTQNTPLSDVRIMLRSGTTLYSSPTFPVMKGR